MNLMKLQKHLSLQAAHFQTKAREIAMSGLRKSADGKTITDADARLIRDHEIRAEVFATAARMAAA